MGFKNFISESEAVSISGVQLATLSRFAEAGYLKVEVDSDGIRLYSKSELESLFGALPEEEDEEHLELISPIHSGEVLDAPLSNNNDIHEIKETAPEVKIDPPREALTSSIEIDRLATQNTTTSSVANRALSLLEREVSKLKTVVELQEKILDLKEKECLDLKGQRDWLHARIQKLEDQRDRDQLILISENQTIRRLLTSIEQKKSPIRTALEWFGFIPPAKEEQNPAQHLQSTIDISDKKAA